MAVKKKKISADKKTEVTSQTENLVGDVTSQKIRGSGYTYDEEQQPTDQAVPGGPDDDGVVKLPDLGRPNRP